MTASIHPLHDTASGNINTWSGKTINLIFPDPDEITIVDIAMGLSNICHFGGQISPFFSVAQHSHLVACIAPEHLKLAALMHDAPEAYIGDVVKPLKILLGDSYKRIESNFTEIIFNKFKIPLNQLKEIKPYDKQIQELEFDYFFKGNKKAFGEIMFFNPVWDHNNPYEIFLRSFNKYFTNGVQR